MVTATYLVIVWAGLLLALLGVVRLADYAEKATKPVWLDLVLLAHSFVIGLIATAALYVLHFTAFR
jgi:hypothetical protein